MAKYYLTHQAVTDLAEIWNYTAETWSEKQADKYYELLLMSCAKLAKHPAKGKHYELVSKGLLGYKSGEHLIFYSIIADGEIEIIRILHGMMDLKINI